MKEYQRGFTLIELLIAMVIISILAAIAYPNYRRHVVDARRQDEAANTLNQLAALQQRYFTECSGRDPVTNVVRGYSGSLGGSIMQRGSDARCSGLGFSSAATVNTSGGNYGIAITARTDGYIGGYEIVATPVTGRSQEGDGFLSIDHTGLRTWDRNNNGTIDANERTWNKR